MRLTSVMRWISSVNEAAEPGPDGGDDECTDGGPYSCEEAEGEGDGHAPHEGQQEIATQVIGAGEAVDLAVDDEAGVDVGVILEDEPGGDELVGALERRGVVFVGGGVGEEADFRS